MRRLPIVSLWLSFIYLVIAFVVTATGCFDALLRIHGALPQYTLIDPATRTWLSEQMNLVFMWFWAMCVAVGVGVLLVAVSALWVSFSRSVHQVVAPGSPPKLADEVLPV